MSTGLQLGKVAGNLFRKYTCPRFQKTLISSFLALPSSIANKGNRLAFIHDLAEVYRPAMNTRKQKLIEIMKEKAEIASKSKVGQNLRILKEYWRVEMAPPKLNELQKLQLDLVIIKEFLATGCWKCLTIKQLWLLFLVGLEIGLWFFIGETFGKGHFVGYHV